MDADDLLIWMQCLCVDMDTDVPCKLVLWELVAGTALAVVEMGAAAAAALAEAVATVVRVVEFVAAVAVVVIVVVVVVVVVVAVVGWGALLWRTLRAYTL